MSGAFQYRPKFVDIRVRPPTPEEEEEKARAEDVLRLKPSEKPCEWPGCSRAGTAKAPKARELPGEFYRFCQSHAAEYNKNWNFFAGMSPGEQQKWREEAVTGHRPTWQFRASRFSREASATTAKGAADTFADPFTLFGGGRARHEPEVAAARRLGKIERQALADLDLDSEADGPAIRARYTELVKRCHPDANGGDRSTEQRLQRVIAAYKTLKKAGLA